MLLRVMRPLLLLVAVLAAACGPAASTSSPSPIPSASASAPSPTASAPTPAPTTTPSASPIPLPNTAQLAAAGNGVVWMLVANDRLFRSLDRGDTWQERGLPGAPFAGTQIAFVDDREGWLMATGSPATQCQSQTVGLYHTIDGAQTWQPLATTGVAEAQCKGALAFRDSAHGYLTAWSPNARPVVYRTADGGRTWVGATIPDPPGFVTQPGGATLQTGPVADFGATLLVAAYGQANGQMRGYAFRSTDAGATWTFVGTMPRSEAGVTFLTASRWFELILPGPSAETTDGGATWHPYTSDYQQAAPIPPQIVFGDASIGYATVRGGLQRTIDGGAHWTALKTPGT